MAVETAALGDGDGSAEDCPKSRSSTLANAIAADERRYIDRLRSACYIRRRLSLKGIHGRLPSILASFDRLYEFHYGRLPAGVLLGRERAMISVYTSYYAVLEAFEVHAVQELESDELLRHVVLTECKLACGEWTDVKELIRLPHHHLHQRRSQFQRMLQSTSKEDVKRYMAIASELCTLNRVIDKIGQWREQKALFNQLAVNIRGLRIAEADGHAGGNVDRAHSVDDLAVHPLDRDGSVLRSFSADTTRKANEDAPVSTGDAERVVTASSVRVKSVWHRMLILTPSHVVLCRPRGLWATCKLLFALSTRRRPAVAERYAVDERFSLRDIVPRLNDRVGPSWLIQEGKAVVFRTDSECSAFLSALQQCILEA